VGIRLSQVNHPGQHVLFYEEFAPNDAYCYGPTDGDDWETGRHGGPGTAEHRSNYGDAAYRTDGRGNVGYFDGHVGPMTIEYYFTYPYFHFGPITGAGS
jgi:prepilin-type processing-associated H-X9-DG protein